MKKIGVIIASVRDGRAGESVAKYVADLANSTGNGFEYKLIDLKAINLPLLNEPYPAVMNNYQYQHTKDWAKLIGGFDGFIIVTPEYNHGYPAAMKNALDYLFVEWNNKPIGFVGYGYSASGARAIEQLRQVLVNLQLKTLWKDVLINLFTNSKDGIFQSNDFVDTQIKDLINRLEATFK
ncbi:MAG: NAD(P)H-dependent oxidoreductase [Burkholderiales bacterium]|nr:NAD(P)H-dependent oxidoreductase [Burkholderiales bacterium]